jgi:hypothetical protein
MWCQERVGWTKEGRGRSSGSVHRTERKWKERRREKSKWKEEERSSVFNRNRNKQNDEFFLLAG